MSPKKQSAGVSYTEVEKHFEALEVLGVVTEVEEGKWRVRGGAGVGRT
jgi:DNA-binding transcriptional ArsR family regulator